MSSGRSRDGQQLQQRMVAFVRAFGLHRPDETPCGAPIPVSEAHALTVLATEGPLAQGGLAARLRLTKSTVSRLVDQLVGRGWVERTPSDDDGRRRLVTLTPQGKDVATGVARRRAERMAQLLDRIPEDQRTAVLQALDVLVEAARED